MRAYAAKRRNFLCCRYGCCLAKRGGRYKANKHVARQQARRAIRTAQVSL